jgi:hypothetical protein
VLSISIGTTRPPARSTVACRRNTAAGSGTCIKTSRVLQARAHKFEPCCTHQIAQVGTRLAAGKVRLLPHGGGSATASQSGGEDDWLRGDQWGADVQLDLRVRGQRDLARIAAVDLAVVQGHYPPSGRAGLGRP